MNIFDDSGLPSPLSESPGYTAADLRQFEKLMAFPGDATGVTRRDSRQTTHEGGSTPETLRYDAGDALAFDKLETLIDAPAVRPSPVTPPTFETAAHGSYTREDAKIFDSLGSFASLERSGPAAATSATTRANRASPGSENQPSLAATDSVEYSEQDLQAFGRLVAAERDQPGADPIEPESRTTTTDTDVGYIKIIDFDREKANGQHRRRPAKAPMKIRFFD